MVYDAQTIHTTVSDYGIKEDFDWDGNTLDKLCFCVKDVLSEDSPKLFYKNWVYNQNTIVIEGIPDKSFFSFVKKVYDYVYENGINLRFPWGAHITAGRFTKQKNSGELSEFFKVMKEAPIIGESKPEFVDVGYFTFNKKRFNFKVHERFNLKS